MYTKKLTPTKIILFLALVVITITLIIVRVIQNREPFVLDAKYLNEEVLMGTLVTDIVGQVDIKEDLIVCLCSTPDDKLLSLYLEKTNSGFSMAESQTLIAQLSSNNKYEYTYFEPLTPVHKDITVYYAVFLTPQDDAIIVNDKSVPIKKIRLEINKEELEIGFWSTALPKDTVIKFG